MDNPDRMPTVIALGIRFREPGDVLQLREQRWHVQFVVDANDSHERALARRGGDRSETADATTDNLSVLQAPRVLQKFAASSARN